MQKERTVINPLFEYIITPQWEAGKRNAPLWLPSSPSSIIERGYYGGGCNPNCLVYHSIRNLEPDSLTMLIDSAITYQGKPARLIIGESRKAPANYFGLSGSNITLLPTLNISDPRKNDSVQSKKQ